MFNVFKKSITYYLFVWFSLIALVPLGFVTFFLYNNSANILTDEIQKKLSVVAEKQMDKIESYFEAKERDIKALSGLPNIKEAIISSNNAYQIGGINSEEYQALHVETRLLLKFFGETYGYYDIFFISPSGDVIVSVEEESDLGTNLYTGQFNDTELAHVFDKAKTTRKVALSKFRYYPPSGKPAMFMASPVIKDNDVVGILVTQLNHNDIYDIAKNYTGLGETGETLLGDKIGDEAVFITPLKYDINAAFNRKVKLDSDNDDDKPIRDAVQGKEGQGLSKNYRGIDSYSVWKHVPSTGWGLVVKIDESEAFAIVSEQTTISFMMMGIAIIFVVPVVIFVARSIANPIVDLTHTAKQIAEGDLEQHVEMKREDEIGQLGERFNDMTAFLKQSRLDLEEHNRTLEQKIEGRLWVSNGQTGLNDIMRGEQNEEVLSRNIVQYLCKYLNAQVGTLYLRDEKNILTLMGSYAFYKRKHLANKFKIGEGLIGQSAFEKEPIILTKVPKDYITISSSLGEVHPNNILVYPFMYNNEVSGLVELGTIDEFTFKHLDFLKRITETIAIAFNTAQAHDRITRLFEEAQQQAEELRTQEEELRTTNEELKVQTTGLQASEKRLQEQQIELESTNTRLEEQASALEKSKNALQTKQVDLNKQNIELKVAQEELHEKAEQLMLTSKYKSEFLANMSHELRTPLNSLLILSKMLADDTEGNLSEDQIESAQIIYDGGNDLLSLINEILDLSKIESGKMEINIESVKLDDLISTVEWQFRHVAEENGLGFDIIKDDGLPESIPTDMQRAGQVIKNLLSNAFKFTEAGNVTLRLHRPEPNVRLVQSGLKPSKAIAIAVSDTGIGMTPDQQKLVFEAFQQADGSTSRQYGGTGLGLSISRELALKLGGEIILVSTYGEGSTFTLYLPVDEDWRQDGASNPGASNPGSTTKASLDPPRASNLGSTLKASLDPPGVANLGLTAFPDDRDDLGEDDKILLVVEDDEKFAKILYRNAHQKGFKCLVALDGKAGLDLAIKYKPTAITLDLRLPTMSGWEILNELKENPDVRHIPVHIMSVDDETMDAYKRGAIGYLTKPISQDDLDDSFQQIEQFISRDIKSLLLVEDDVGLRQSVIHLLGGEDIAIIEADNGVTALDFLRSRPFDCMILDLSLPDMNGFELLNVINDDETISKCPIIIYTGKDLTTEENKMLTKYADSVIIKGVKSPERLLDETALFLHRVIADMPTEKQQTIQRLHDGETLFEGKTILIVDDDMRNAFALSRLLSDKGMKIEIAANGKNGLDLLKKKSDTIDLVLMDIMMPIMDGYEATKQIRKDPKFRKLPIIALTAKAMKGDREKCIAAGSNDYLSKPLDTERLFSMLRIWLYQ